MEDSGICRITFWIFEIPDTLCFSDKTIAYTLGMDPLTIAYTFCIFYISATLNIIPHYANNYTERAIKI